jgi:phosphoglycolate phosphatase-like HAD superfamily hydrolase
MLKQIKVYDMDGTIVDSSHRYRTVTVDGVEKIDLQYWRENSTPEKIMADGFLPLYSEYCDDLADPHTYVIIATARVMTAADWRFVNEKLGAPDYFIYRKDNDTRRGADMKKAGLKKLFSLRQFAKVARRVFFEDNKDYLAIAPDLGMVPVFVESNQGH